MSQIPQGVRRSDLKVFVYSRPRAFRPYRLFWIFFGAAFLFDQLTKVIVVLTIDYPTYHYPDPIAVIPGLFYFVHIGNQGAAWGMLQDFQWFLLLLAFASLVAIYAFRRSLGLAQRKVQVAFGLLCGGIVGNVLDRLLYGHVVDFIDVHLPLVNYRWPAFNIADMAIVSGVLLYLFFSFTEKEA
jgi:signal peptidase II